MTKSDTRGWLSPRKRVPEDRALTAQSVPPVMLNSTAGGTTVTPTTALGIADVWAAVRVLADAAASVPLVPYRKTADGRTRAEGALADLLRAPAPATTQAGLMGQVDGSLAAFRELLRREVPRPGGPD